MSDWEDLYTQECSVYRPMERNQTAMGASSSGLVLMRQFGDNGIIDCRYVPAAGSKSLVSGIDRIERGGTLYFDTSSLNGVSLLPIDLISLNGVLFDISSDCDIASSNEVMELIIRRRVEPE